MPIKEVEEKRQNAHLANRDVEENARKKMNRD